MCVARPYQMSLSDVYATQNPHRDSCMQYLYHNKAIAILGGAVYVCAYAYSGARDRPGEPPTHIILAYRSCHVQDVAES